MLKASEETRATAWLRVIDRDRRAKPRNVIHTSAATGRAGSATAVDSGDETSTEIHSVTSLFASVLFVISVMAGVRMSFILSTPDSPPFT